MTKTRSKVCRILNSMEKLGFEEVAEEDFGLIRKKKKYTAVFRTPYGVYYFVPKKDRYCNKCKALIMTQNFNLVKSMKGHSLSYVNVCDDCATDVYIEVHLAKRIEVGESKFSYEHETEVNRLRKVFPKSKFLKEYVQEMKMELIDYHADIRADMEKRFGIILSKYIASELKEIQRLLYEYTRKSELE